jgi:hypothetical protein
MFTSGACSATGEETVNNGMYGVYGYILQSCARPALVLATYISFSIIAWLKA